MSGRDALEATADEAAARERRRLNRLAGVFFSMSVPCAATVVYVAVVPRDPGNSSQVERDIVLWGGVLTMGAVTLLTLVAGVSTIVQARRVAGRPRR